MLDSVFPLPKSGCHTTFKELGACFHVFPALVGTFQGVIEGDSVIVGGFLDYGSDVSCLLEGFQLRGIGDLLLSGSLIPN